VKTIRVVLSVIEVTFDEKGREKDTFVGTYTEKFSTPDGIRFHNQGNDWFIRPKKVKDFWSIFSNFYNNLTIHFIKEANTFKRNA
jgi:hypothetical protein